MPTELEPEREVPLKPLWVRLATLAGVVIGLGVLLWLGWRYRDAVARMSWLSWVARLSPALVALSVLAQRPRRPAQPTSPSGKARWVFIGVGLVVAIIAVATAAVVATVPRHPH